MRFKYLALAAALAPAAAFAQITPVALTSADYTEDFDSLASGTGTGSVLPSGFTFVETGTAANGTYGIGNGSSNTGNTYSFGATGSNERAFGSLASGALESVFGFLFTNGLGSTITSFDFSYTGEQWRRGTSNATDNLVFEYSTNATSLTSGTWTAVTALNFDPVSIAGGQAALDGNLAANQRDLFATIGGLNILAGQNFAFRWTDVDSAGADHGLAVDDVRIISNLQSSAVPEPATWAMMTLGFGALGFAMRRRPKVNARIRFA